MQIKIDAYVMTCIWMAQFPSFYLERYLECKDIRPHLLALLIMGRITPAQEFKLLDYAKENNLI